VRDGPSVRTLHADDGSGNPICGDWKGSLTHLATKWVSLAVGEGCPACVAELAEESKGAAGNRHD
jgi:hypothetical protein